MKKIFLPLLLVLVVVCSVLPASAASGTAVDQDTLTVMFDGDPGDSFMFEYWVKVSDYVPQQMPLVGSIQFVENGSLKTSSGEFYYYGENIFIMSTETYPAGDAVLVVTESSGFFSPGIYFFYDPAVPDIYVTSFSMEILPSGTGSGDQTPAGSHAIYQSLYSLLHKHIYGSADLTPEMTLTLVQLSTFFCVALIFIPFIPFIWLLKRWF